MIMGSFEHIGNIAYASIARVISAYELAACGPIRASLEFDDGAAVAKFHKLQVQSDGKKQGNFNIWAIVYNWIKYYLMELTNMRL